MSTQLTVRKSLIDKAFALTVASPKIEGVQEELNALRGTRDTLLPVEERARLKITERIDELHQTLVRGGFTEPMMPMEPLTWRWKSGLPKLALLSLAGSSFNITAQRNNANRLGWTINPRLPEPLWLPYRDVAKLAESFCIRRNSLRSFTFTFDGVIPSETRVKIAEALASRRFEGLYMLVETPDTSWKVETKKGLSRWHEFRERFANINIDPLILGYAQEALWVVDKFDLTTLEQYVLDEFSQKALLPGS